MPSSVHRIIGVYVVVYGATPRRLHRTLSASVLRRLGIISSGAEADDALSHDEVIPLEVDQASLVL